MKYLFIFLGSLIVAVVLGYFISDDAGFVVIGYGGKVFRTSFVVFIALLIAGLTAVTIAWRVIYQLLTLKTRWQHWRAAFRRKRSRQALSNGLIALAEGNFNRAEKLLGREAGDPSDTGIQYLSAAEAAHAQNAPDRRDTYLRLARDAMPTAEVAIQIKRAEMQLASQQTEQARTSLDYLADRHPDNKHVLRLQRQLYTLTGDTRAMLRLLPALRRHRVLEPDQLDKLELEAAEELLAGPFTSVEGGREIWQRLPKAARSNGACVALYARQLTALGDHDEAEELVRKSLKRRWRGDLVRQYGDVCIDNVALQLKRAEAWLVNRTDDPELLLTLAKLSLGAADSDKARSYLDRLIDLAPSPLAYRLLAEVHERAHDHTAANHCQREGLRLATAEAGGLPVVTDTA